MDKVYKNPAVSVDIIIELEGRGIVLIRRKNRPYGWAIPGGFVDAGETLEEAAVREALEETSLKVRLKCQLHAYSDPERDPRQHTISVVFAARAEGEPVAGDDAAYAAVFTEEGLPADADIAFDHALILRDYFRWKKAGWAVFNP